jgi:F0F1-type ATP synthase membrane subunit b/b'
LYEIGAELQEQASEKVEEAKENASELAADAQQKGEGKRLRFQRKIS